MTKPWRRGCCRCHVDSQLQEGHDWMPPQVGRDIRSSRATHPVGFSVEGRGLEEGNWIARVLQVEDSRRSPYWRRHGRCLRVSREADDSAVAKSGSPRRACRCPFRRRLPPRPALERWTDPERSLKWIADDIPKIGGQVGVERPKAQPVQIQSGTLCLGQRSPVGVDRSEDRAGRVGAIVWINE